MLPAVNAIGPDALPEPTDAPFTVIVADGSSTLAVIVIEATLLGTTIEYVVVRGSNTWCNAPKLGLRLFKSLFDEGWRITITVYVLVTVAS